MKTIQKAALLFAFVLAYASPSALAADFDDPADTGGGRFDQGDPGGPRNQGQGPGSNNGRGNDGRENEGRGNEGRGNEGRGDAGEPGPGFGDFGSTPIFQTPEPSPVFASPADPAPAAVSQGPSGTFFPAPSPGTGFESSSPIGGAPEPAFTSSASSGNTIVPSRDPSSHGGSPLQPMSSSWASGDPFGGGAPILDQEATADVGPTQSTAFRSSFVFVVTGEVVAKTKSSITIKDRHRDQKTVFVEPSVASKLREGSTVQVSLAPGSNRAQEVRQLVR